jgi:hypothetical protein
MRTRNAIDKTPRLGELAGRERKPRDEADVVRGAIRQYIVAAAVDQVVAILHRRHRTHPRAASISATDTSLSPA